MVSHVTWWWLNQNHEEIKLIFLHSDTNRLKILSKQETHLLFKIYFQGPSVRQWNYNLEWSKIRTEMEELS